MLSGGIMQRALLFPKIRAAVQAQLNGYIQLPQITTQDGIDAFVAPSFFGNSAGVVGALTLARKALDDSKTSGGLAVPPLGVAALVAAAAFGAGLALGALRRAS